MSEQRDDTPESAPTPRPARRERADGSYYYDDGTGYEVYVPEEDEEETPDTAQPRAET